MASIHKYVSVVWVLIIGLWGMVIATALGPMVIHGVYENF